MKERWKHKKSFTRKKSKKHKHGQKSLLSCSDDAGKHTHNL